MLDKIREAAETLRDTTNGWVTRRDAAEFLGRAAALSLVTLHERADEMDVDVKRAIDKALAQASAALQGVSPEAERHKSYAIGDLVRSCEKKGAREINKQDGGFQVTVHLGEGRKQLVYVEPYKRKDGTDLYRVYTYCGVFSESVTGWALRANMKLAQGALAVTRHEGEERFVLMNCLIANETTPVEMKVAVKATAYYGDWIEKKMTGLDDF